MTAVARRLGTTVLAIATGALAAIGCGGGGSTPSPALCAAARHAADLSRTYRTTTSPQQRRSAGDQLQPAIQRIYELLPPDLDAEAKRVTRDLRAGRGAEATNAQIALERRVRQNLIDNCGADYLEGNPRP